MAVAIPKSMQGQTVSHARSRSQEKETADRLGGNVVHRSGAGLVKGDVRVRGITRIENKTTLKKSFSVNAEHISKLEAAVAGSSEIPFLQVELLGGAVKFVVIPDLFLDDIVELLKEKYESSQNPSIKS